MTNNLPRLDAVSRVGSEATTPAQCVNPSQAPAQSMDSHSGTASIPGAFTVSTEQASYDSGDEFDYKGKVDGAYSRMGKSNTRYSYLDTSCSDVTIDPPSSSMDAPPAHKNGGQGFHRIMHNEGAVGC